MNANLFSINLKGRLFTLESPRVMGIINLTPDSFYDGGRLKSNADVLLKAEKMLAEGAFLLDIGGYSTRPGANEVSIAEETKRTCTAIEAILKNFPEAKISVDTFRSKVAEECLLRGACIINDISGGLSDEAMYATVAKHKAAYVLMHSRGTPQTMQSLANYQDVVQEVFFELSERIASAKAAGIKDIIVDVGLGFAKNLTQNYALLKNLSYFKNLDLPMLVGLSRKSMIYKALNTTPEFALNGTTALHMAALLERVVILRVHDVKEAMETILLYHHLTAKN